MESIIIWYFTIILIAVIFIPYYIKFRRSQKQNRERKKEAQELGIDRPTSQFPFINQTFCIGCGSCVLACPEGDVLGIVYGKATVINGLRCIGHGFCEPACPVGALKVGLGDIKERDDIPIMDEFNQTNVPGLFIAGELGGISLIRNAVEQGKRVVQQIVSQRGETPSDAPDDLIIVGAGPAGMSAALEAHRNGLKYKIFDQQDMGGTILKYPRQKLVMTQPVEIPLYGRLNKSELEKEQLLEIWYSIINKHQIIIHSGIYVSGVRKENGLFKVISSEGEFKSAYVILAMGRRGTPRKLEIPGENKSKVLYQLIDAQSYQNKKILVVGGGDSAVEAAVGLARQKGNSVTISYRKEKFFRIKKKNEDRILEMIDGKKIKPLFNSSPTEIKDHSVTIKHQDKTIEIPNDFIFIFAGGIPPFQMLKEMGIKFGGETKTAVINWTKVP